MNKIYALLVFLVLLASSCKDPCKDVNCNNGNCLEGTCLCDDGYEGVNCDKEEREKFVGTWVGIVDCGELFPGGEATLVVMIDPDDASAVLFDLEIPIPNVDSPLEPIKGTVSGDKIFITSDTQVIDIGFEVEITVGGQGELNEAGGIDMNFTVTSVLIGSLDCSGILMKQ